MSEEECEVPILTLKAEPYLLAWGSSVYARVLATNNLGDSLVSDAGNGAIILTYPDAPVDLMNDEQQTSGTQISLVWTEGTSSGGTAVLDYTIVAANDGVTFVER